MIPPVSRATLKRLIKTHGLQACLFDKSLFTLDWEGLEYQFYEENGKIYLFRITVRMDVALCQSSNLNDYIQKKSACARLGK